MEELLEALKEMMKSVVADEEFFDLMAQMTKKMYDALIRQGFTEDAAIKITASLMANGPVKASR